MIYDGERVSAELMVERSAPLADLAVLRLTLPDSRKNRSPWPYLPLDVHWRVALNDTLRSFGYPVGQFGKSGIPIVGKLGGVEPVPVDGVEVLPIAGLNLDNVDGGYSGAPVVNQVTQKVIASSAPGTTTPRLLSFRSHRSLRLGRSFLPHTMCSSRSASGWESRQKRSLPSNCRATARRAVHFSEPRVWGVSRIRAREETKPRPSGRRVSIPMDGAGRAST